jgi:hypothetical protein
MSARKEYAFHGAKVTALPTGALCFAGPRRSASSGTPVGSAPARSGEHARPLRVPASAARMPAFSRARPGKQAKSGGARRRTWPARCRVAAAEEARGPRAHRGARTRAGACVTALSLPGEVLGGRGYGPDQRAAATVPKPSSRMARHEYAASLRHMTLELKKASAASATMDRPRAIHATQSG